jgi:hypothetical protein
LSLRFLQRSHSHFVLSTLHGTRIDVISLDSNHVLNFAMQLLDFLGQRELIPRF